MKDKINSINMNGKLNNEEIYNLFKTYSSKTNKEISEKIQIFKHNIDFFGYYANKDIKNLLKIFDLKISENNDETFPSFKSDIEEYISCTSQIILLIKLFLKTQDILTKIAINAKNHLSKLKSENKVKSYNQDFLFLYLESLLQNSEKNHKIHLSTSSLLSSENSSFELIPKNNSYHKLYSQYKIDIFSKHETESIKYDNRPTPRFELDEEFENQEKKNTKQENLIEYHTDKKEGTIFTFSEKLFDEETLSPPNLEPKLIDTSIIKPKTKTSTKLKIPQSENINKVKHKRNIFSETDVIIKNKKKNECKNLLEMINKMYKKGSINCEEKIKLKKLVIEKSKKIEYFYNNIYKNLENDKNKLVSEIKKIVN